MRTPKWALRAVQARQGSAKLPWRGSPSSRMRRAVSLACLRALRASPLVMGLRLARLLRAASAAVMCREMRRVSAQRPVKRSRWPLVRVSRKSWTRGWRAGGVSPRAAVPVRVVPRTERAAAMVGSMPSRRCRRVGVRAASVALQPTRGSPVRGSPDRLVCGPECGPVCVTLMIIIPS
ncbi:hypothetical protein TU94_13660 [Streptomyces cyaneogriseus subsp. noncyanogenus]|uniref:Uncharacterized protein n=1 Tax=Streptomyces cyaneogriseus subsp. noncyanogenus TaxID=477245 RepID=A0A0C5FXG6_9ACTN|nr:hypothetical protein TU94_13660 [Streptomyces cyaneogriseus subsp. noncyanogenus]